jgi:hypothetical protein
VRATAIEVRHATLLRQLIFVTAFATYFVDPDDVVWRLIRQYPSRRMLEHGLFFIATLLIGGGAILCTRSGAFIPRPDPSSNTQEPLSATYGRLRCARHVGDLMYAIGLASLAPMWGCVLLITGESIRILRLARYESACSKDQEFQSAPAMNRKPDERAPYWGPAFRRQATKWGVFLTMIVFTITLVDRVADYGIVASVLAWLPLNLPFRR